MESVTSTSSHGQSHCSSETNNISSHRQSHSSSETNRPNRPDLEADYQALRNSTLANEDDLEFHRFIATLDLADSLVVERTSRNTMRSLYRRFSGVKKGIGKQRVDKIKVSPSSEVSVIQY